jgi:Kef-type K+ transport system membrane component KefB
VGQPQVVAEMIAGILLGPSLFGALFPNAQTALFPPESMPPDAARATRSRSASR